MIITPTMVMAGMNLAGGIFGGLGAKKGANRGARMQAEWTARGQDLNFRSAKEGTLAGMGTTIGAWNNDALAQRENATITKDMALFGAGELADKKSRSTADHSMRMLGVQNSDTARSIEKFQNLLNASGSGRAASSSMAGMFGETGADVRDRMILGGFA